MRRNVFRAAAGYIAVAWLLTQVAETVMPAFGWGDQAVRWIVIFALAGFLPVLAVSWAFEFTSQGIQRETPADVAPSARGDNRLVDRLIVILLAVAVTYFTIDKFVLDPGRDAGELQAAREMGRIDSLMAAYGDRSIVVLPFVNMSSDPEQEYFADGIAEELLNLLAAIEELRVISRTSAFSFKGQSVPVSEIAAQLQVAYVLEGSVRKSGNQVRITAQLIEAGTDAHKWSQTYDRELDDLFAIQDDIAGRVVEQLKLHILPPGRAANPPNPQAYVLYTQARQMLDDSFEADYDRAFALMTQALEIDPDYAEVHNGLAWLFFRFRVLDEPERYEVFQGRTFDETERLRQEHIDRALALDPENPTAIAYRAWSMAFDERRYLDAAPLFERSIRLAPANPDVQRTALMYLRKILRNEDAVRLGEFGLVRDPLCRLCRLNLVQAYVESGQFDNAESLLPSVDDPRLDSLRANVSLLQGNFEEALVQFDALGERWWSRLKGRSMALYSLGLNEASLESLAELEAHDDQQSTLLIAEVHAWRQEPELALAWIEKAIEQIGPEWVLSEVLRNPVLKSYATQPPLADWAREHNLAPDQLQAIAFDLQLPGN